MIVVTGGPRMGTSWTMQTLGHLGIPTTGELFNTANRPEHNPEGYYELPVEDVRKGVSDHRHKGMAVKLIGAPLVYTNPDYISKIIVCRRFIGHAAKSFKKYFEGSFEWFEGCGRTITQKPTREMCVEAIEDCVWQADEVVKHYGKPHMEMDFGMLRMDPKLVINKIKEFVGSDADITKALENTRRQPCQQEQLQQ